MLSKLINCWLHYTRWLQSWWNRLLDVI